MTTPTTPSMDIEALEKLAKAADAAIKSGKAFVEGTQEINIWSKPGMAITSFYNAANPQAILTLISEKRALEQALERVALLDEADGHLLTVKHAFEAVAIAVTTLGKHPSEIYAARAPSHGEKK